MNEVQREYESVVEESVKELRKEFSSVETELEHRSIETR
jgi:hypothetical protein